MKVHMISDIEGVAGIVKCEQTSGDSPLYQEGRRLYTREALGDLAAVTPYDPGRPCEIRVVFHHTDGVAAHRWKSGVEVVGPRELVSRGDDWWTAWRQFFF